MNRETWTGLLAVVVILLVNRLLLGAWLIPRGTPVRQALEELRSLLVTVAILMLARVRAAIRVRERG